MYEEHIPREKLLGASNGSIYELAMLLAKRALQLADGATPLIEKAEDKVLDSAFREVLEGKIKVREKEEE
jgi:DNA-directed RNA polymerase subunit K/omega